MLMFSHHCSRGPVLRRDGVCMFLALSGAPLRTVGSLHCDYITSLPPSLSLTLSLSHSLSPPPSRLRLVLSGGIGEDVVSKAQFGMLFLFSSSKFRPVDNVPRGTCEDLKRRKPNATCSPQLIC